MKQNEIEQNKTRQFALNVFGVDSPNTLIVTTPEMMCDFALKFFELAMASREQQSETLYTPDEFAERWHVSKSTLWRWVREGKLKKTCVNKKVFYKDSDLKFDQTADQLSK